MCVCWMLGLCWVAVVWPRPSARPHPRPLSRCCRVFWGRGGIVAGGGVGWWLGALEGLVVGGVLLAPRPPHTPLPSVAPLSLRFAA